MCIFTGATKIYFLELGKSWVKLQLEIKYKQRFFKIAQTCDLLNIEKNRFKNETKIAQI